MLLPTLFFFSILAGLGGLLLTAKPFSTSAHAQNTFNSVLPRSLSNFSPDKMSQHGHVLWDQYLLTLQHYTAVLSQRLVPALTSSPDTDMHVARDSWQQHVVPAGFKHGKGFSGSMQLAGAWQHLSVQMLMLGDTCSNFSRSWTGKLPRLLPGSQHDSTAMQPLSGAAFEGGLKPELAWRHVLAVLHRASNVLRKADQPLASELANGKAF